MTKAEIAAAMNEWMRRYIEEPTRFAAEFQTIGEFLKEEAEGEEPSYGVVCADYIAQINAELAA